MLSLTATCAVYSALHACGAWDLAHIRSMEINSNSFHPFEAHAIATRQTSSPLLLSIEITCAGLSAGRCLRLPVFVCFRYISFSCRCLVQHRLPSNESLVHTQHTEPLCKHPSSFSSKQIVHPLVMGFVFRIGLQWIEHASGKANKQKNPSYVFFFSYYGDGDDGSVFVSFHSDTGPWDSDSVTVVHVTNSQYGSK